MPYIGKKPSDIIATAVDTTTGQFSGTLGVTGETTLSANLNLGDNDKAIFGEDSDLQIYHDSSNSIIKDAGTGRLQLLSNRLDINKSDGTEGMATFIEDAQVILYYDNNVKFQTTSTGIDVTGTATMDGLTLAPSQVINLNSGADSFDDIFRNESENATIINARNNVRINLDSNSDSTNAEFVIGYNGTNTTTAKALSVGESGDISFYEDTGTTPKLFWDSSAERLGIGTSSPSTTLDVNGNATITGFLNLGTNLNMPDNEKIIMGDGDDLQIYHDSANGNSYIQDAGTGQLRLEADSVAITNTGHTEYVALFNENADVKLYYDGLEKLATTSTGINVKGKGEFSSANPDVNGLKITANTGTNASAMQFTNAVNGYVGLDNSTGGRFGSDNYGLVMYQGSPYPITFHTNGTKRMTIDANGHVTMPYQPAFSAKPTSTQSNIAVNSFVKILFATEIFDQNEDFASSTFTAPTTGRYQLSVNLYILGGDTASGFYQMKLETSNRNYLVTIEPAFTSDMSYFSFFNLSILADMDAGDTAEVYFYQSSGTAQTDISSASYFMGYLVA